MKCEVEHGLGVHARAGLAGDEKGLIYIFKATSAPPRAGTTGTITHKICEFNDCRNISGI